MVVACLAVSSPVVIPNRNITRSYHGGHGVKGTWMSLRYFLERHVTLQ